MPIATPGTVNNRPADNNLDAGIEIKGRPTLKEAGFQVVEGGNGEEGLDRLGAGKVDLIISDVNMPVMDGITFVQQLRTLPSSRCTPVLMLTTETAPGKKAAAKAAGATGWLV